MSYKYYIFVFVILFEITVSTCGFPPARSTKCKGYVPKKKPDLYGRISETKCQEYIWQMNDLIRRERHFSQCGVRKYGVINGKPSKITQFPHMAALGWLATDVGTKWEFFCGGSLISDRFVLTAAHCTWIRVSDKITDSEPKIVRLGATFIRENLMKVSSATEKPTDIEIKRMIKHERYRSPYHYFDIALVELKERVTFTKFIQPACLRSENDFDTSKRYEAAGWGTTKVIGDYRSPGLQSTVLSIFEYNDCKKSAIKNRNFAGIQDHQMCAIGNDTDTCKGDSGGPLMYKIIEGNEENANIHMIVGITSFGFKCAVKDSPGIYTKVCYFIDWIEKNVWPKEAIPTPKYRKQYKLEKLESRKGSPKISEKVEKDSRIKFPDMELQGLKKTDTRISPYIFFY